MSWYSKKHDCISLSTGEAEYVTAGSCCTQLLWRKHLLDDYGITHQQLIMYCDNTSAINITKNSVQHCKTIDIGHHFIKELVEHGVVEVEYVPTLKQIADILTKPLDV